MSDYSCLDYRYHGALLSALKKYDQAIEEYGKALEKDESQVDLWREIADAYELKNDYTQAIAAYKKYYDSLAQDKKDVRKLIPVRASVLRRGYVLGHSLRSVCRPHGGIAGWPTLCSHLLPNKLPTVIWEICGAPAHTLPWTPKLQRDWRNLITRRWWTYCLPKTNRGTTLH